ncbi:hypothetical protein [Marinisporobacter balticus]|uniref:Uncharacterized protein n=1 Tax=Marinisporobacter balticus TaxID=2018667 RepID=A0A4R2KG41_9FIRM|nr:hypothetical protein [Marinisporobacter balticus]TCO68928.1 hypothetical protein EV214_13720 [Marinisporobacter balticus]
MKMSNRMKAVIKTIFGVRVNWTKDTGIAFLSGILVILCSIVLVAFQDNTMVDEFGFFLFRDIVMIFCIGFAFPLYYVLIIKKDAITDSYEQSIAVHKKGTGIPFRHRYQVYWRR